jgi:hypothetical protein
MQDIQIVGPLGLLWEELDWISHKLLIGFQRRDQQPEYWQHEQCCNHRDEAKKCRLS